MCSVDGSFVRHGHVEGPHHDTEHRDMNTRILVRLKQPDFPVDSL